MKSGRLALAALIVMGSVAVFPAAGPSGTDPQVDPVFHESIEQAVSALVRQDDSAQGPIDALAELAMGRRKTLLLQLALYLRDSGGTERSMAGALILRHFEFTPDEKLDAILPHLETAEPGLRRVLTELLGTIDRPEGGDPDFSFYETRLRREKSSPPPALVSYLYDVSPDIAVQTMARIYGGSDVSRDLRDLLARRDMAGARAALDRLSQDPAWWVRLYAAGIMSANPELAASAVMLRLMNDPDPLVRRAVPR